MKIFILLVLLSICLAPNAWAHSPTAGQNDPGDLRPQASDELSPEEARRSIKAWLSHHHQVPSRAELERITPEARSIVFDIARDEDVFLFHRHRALVALGHWPDQEVKSYLQTLLNNETTEDGLRHHLIPILATSFGEAALEDLRPFLIEAADPQIRISAAAAIAEIPGDQALQLLKQALEVERHPLVRSRLENYAKHLK